MSQDSVVLGAKLIYFVLSVSPKRKPALLVAEIIMIKQSYY